MKQLKSLKNPLNKDFTVIWAGDENNPQAYTIHSNEIATFPEHIAIHISKHLCEAVYQARGQQTNHDDDITEIRKEVELVKS